MSNLKLIADRHGRDSWRDIGFVLATLVIAALYVGLTTSGILGKVTPTWQVIMVDPVTNETVD